MATNALTDAKCKSAKPGEKGIKLFDGGGLFLYLTPKGSKIWRIAYRVDGKPQQASLGEYPAVSLAQARARREEIKIELSNGKDPMAKRREERQADRNKKTLEQANEEYWDTRGDLSPAYLKKSKRAIEQHLYPRFKDLQLDAITREDLLEVLRSIDAAGKSVYVRKIRLWLGMIYDWAVENSFATSNPAALINPKRAFSRAKVVSLAALELREVPAFVQRLAVEPELQSVLGCKLLALTWLRTNELRRMLWSDIDGDLIRIPGQRMKRDKDHLVPLSRQALEVIEQMRLRRNGSDYVFPSDRRTDRPMSENAILYLLHRIGYKGRMTGHGWRSVGSTWANERGHDKDAIERQLAHTPDNKVRSVYNRAEYLPQRRQILQAWADWLESCEVDASSAQGGESPAGCTP